MADTLNELSWWWEKCKSIHHWNYGFVASHYRKIYWAIWLLGVWPIFHCPRAHSSRVHSHAHVALRFNPDALAKKYFTFHVSTSEKRNAQEKVLHDHVNSSVSYDASTTQLKNLTGTVRIAPHFGSRQKDCCKWAPLFVTLPHLMTGHSLDPFCLAVGL